MVVFFFLVVILFGLGVYGNISKKFGGGKLMEMIIGF